MTRLSKILDRVSTFLSEGGFPVFALALLFCWEIFLLTVLLLPARPEGFSAFAADFRVWCLGYDPATGHIEWAYVMAMMLPPLLVGAFIALFWWDPLREARRRPRFVAFHASVAASLVLAASASFALAGGRAPTGELPFPAEALRTAYQPPEIVLTNQLGEPVDLASMRGKVVVLTAVYASCGHTCPLLLTQAKAAVAELAPEQRSDLRLLAVTLDPEHDSPDVLGRLAQGFGLEAPLYQLLTGPPHEVEDVLDRMQVARTRDPDTGVIDHANLFLLIDREGRLAYRLGLGERQQRWLTSALRVLLDEQGPAS